MENSLNLPPRLLTIAKLASPCRVLADIGTDHALLPAWMIRSDLCGRAYACDINSGPLKRAEATVVRWNLSDRIQLILSDGLRKVPCEYDVLTIAGMGGDLIAKILYDTPPEESVRIVLQPMSKPEVLRRFLMRNGYRILRETAVSEGAKCYIILTAQRSEAASEPEFFRPEIPQNLDCTPDALVYLEKLLTSHQKRIFGLSSAEDPQEDEILREREITAELMELWRQYSRRLYDETH